MCLDILWIFKKKKGIPDRIEALLYVSFKKSLFAFAETLSLYLKLIMTETPSLSVSSLL